MPESSAQHQRVARSCGIQHQEGDEALCALLRRLSLQPPYSIYEGDTVKLTAVANEGYVFYRWDDATRENPRTAVSTQDETYEVFFNQSQSIKECDNAGLAFTIMPNPVQGQVTLQLPEGALGQGEVVLCCESGKDLSRLQTEVGSLTLSIRDLAAGAYFVTFVTVQGSSTRKLLVE